MPALSSPFPATLALPATRNNPPFSYTSLFYPIAIMASPSSTTFRHHSNARPEPTVTQDAQPSPTSPFGLEPSLAVPDTRQNLHSSIPKINDTFDSIPLPHAVSEPKRNNTSQEVLRGFQLLGLDVPQRVATKAATSYTDMAPMARFLAETCDIDPKVAEADKTVYGAISKDGPSAGITMTTSPLSLTFDTPLIGA
ncbi:hypothetical protein FDECE_919 [Fusarium decemcellulare]|nr:hypothetical protein FDECE_919 [Fusarium decemcellulare]